MSDKDLVTKRPTGIFRWLLRFPIVMYRLGLGGLLGGRFMLIHHIGRKSGQARQAIVEVIRHDKASDTYFAASGWGYNAHWYRNLVATPEVMIHVGRREFAVTAETISAEQGAEILIAYRQKHQFAADQLGQVMGLDIGHAPIEELETMIRESLPIVGFRRVANRT